jgi:hypothetical protein
MSNCALQKNVALQYFYGIFVELGFQAVWAKAGSEGAQAVPREMTT